MVEEGSDPAEDLNPEHEDEIIDEVQEGSDDTQREEPRTLGRSALIALVVAIIIAISVILLQSGNSDSLLGRTGRAIGIPGSAVEHLHPCELISNSELEEILGTSLTKGEELSAENPLGEMICGFNSSESQDLLLLISIFHTDRFETFLQADGYTVSQLFDGNRGAEGATEVVGDLGVRAYWGGAGDDNWNGLHVLLGDAYLHLTLPTGVRILTQTEAEDIARILLAKIQ
ncbi:MAG: hypothetical protein ACERKX_09630 [Anaerolineales bacterium]